MAANTIQPELVESKEIPLTRGYFAIVDAEDYDKLIGYNWQVQLGRAGSTPYARRGTWINGASTTIGMHRQILGVTDSSIVVDHINGNGLDNRRCNLRLATGRQNHLNGKMRSCNTSGYRGVTTPRGSRVGWQAQITVSNHVIYLGKFDTAEEAARAYDAAAVRYNGVMARLNFPDENYKK